MYTLEMLRRDSAYGLYLWRYRQRVRNGRAFTTLWSILLASFLPMLAATYV